MLKPYLAAHGCILGGEATKREKVRRSRVLLDAVRQIADDDSRKWESMGFPNWYEDQWEPIVQALAELERLHSASAGEQQPDATASNFGFEC